MTAIDSDSERQWQWSATRDWVLVLFSTVLSELVYIRPTVIISYTAMRVVCILFCSFCDMVTCSVVRVKSWSWSLSWQKSLIYITGPQPWLSSCFTYKQRLDSIVLPRRQQIEKNRKLNGPKNSALSFFKLPSEDRLARLQKQRGLQYWRQEVYANTSAGRPPNYRQAIWMHVLCSRAVRRTKTHFTCQLFTKAAAAVSSKLQHGSGGLCSRPIHISAVCQTAVV